MNSEVELGESAPSMTYNMASELGNDVVALPRDTAGDWVRISFLPSNTRFGLDLDPLTLEEMRDLQVSLIELRLGRFEEARAELSDEEFLKLLED